jgi:hypothetical protein
MWCIAGRCIAAWCTAVRRRAIAWRIIRFITDPNR